MESAWVFSFGLFFWMNNISKIKHSSLPRHFLTEVLRIFQRGSKVSNYLRPYGVFRKRNVCVPQHVGADGGKKKITVVKGFGYVFRRLNFSVYSLVFVSIEKIYQTLKTVFHPRSKHLEFRQKLLRCALYFQLSSWCLDIPMKHCLSCLIYYLQQEVLPCQWCICIIKRNT